MAAADLYKTADYYRKRIPATYAQQAADRLGISTDQLFNYFAQIGNPNVLSTVPNQGPTSNQSYGGMGGQQQFVNTSGIEQLVAATKAGAGGGGTAAAAPGAAPNARPSYLGAAPQISMGTASPGGLGAGDATTMADGNLTPEQRALQQLGQTDPASEALRQAVAQSYLTPLQQAGAPTAAQFQSNLDIYRQLDPTGAAAREKLGSDLAAQEALGTQLDAATQREIEQATIRAQGARGNVYGTPQLVQEAMTRGQAGLALQQQRQQALQSYLSSGQTTGDVAMNLYNQQQQQLRASQGAAVGYLGSGQTPYQAGASYLNTAEGRAAAAGQGGPQYSPQALGMGYSGAGSPSFPQYGLDISQLAGNWYNNINQANLQAYGLQQAYGQKGGSAGGAAIGALGGAASGALAGSAMGPVGTVVGGLGGALAGGLSGYSR